MIFFFEYRLGRKNERTKREVTGIYYGTLLRKNNICLTEIRFDSLLKVASQVS